MKRNKKRKRLLSSFVCLIGGSIGSIIGLSSCVSNQNNDKNDDESDDSTITPPNDENDNNSDGEDNGNIGDDIEKPIEPDTQPDVKPPLDNNPSEPNLPENKPNPVPPNSNLIDNKSISLKQHGQLLPSQYLLNINDLNNLNIDKVKIMESFDSNRVIVSSYTVLSLNDWDGTLSIKMEYRSKIDDNIYEFIFNFSNLAKLEEQRYNLYFDVSNRSLLNAKEISSKIVTNDSEAKSFFQYLSEKEANLIFKNGANYLPLNYLNFTNGLSFDGFKNSWYTSNNDLDINIKPKLLKINFYEKNENVNNLTIKQKNYPTNLVGSSRQPIKLSCSSALDYLLEKIDVNNEYKENKFASYYYYDIVNNQYLKSQLQLSNDKWLKNVTYDIDGYTSKKYKPVISKTIDPKIDNKGNLIIQIQVQLSDDDVFSKKSKELIIKSFLPINENMFCYDNDKNNKFNLFCEGDEQDIILDIIKKKNNFSDIKKEIDTSDNKIVDITKYFYETDSLRIKNNIKLYFGSSEIIKYNDYFCSTDEKISIKHYLISYCLPNNTIIQYDKINKRFQAKYIVAIECEGMNNESSTSEAMTVNITKINAPLE